MGNRQLRESDLTRLQQVYPGVQWRRGDSVTNFNESHAAFLVPTKQDLCCTIDPYGLSEPLLWCWTKLPKTDPTVAGQGNGTTWVELLIGFQLATAVDVSHMVEGTLNLKRQADLFSKASVWILRYIKAWNKTCRTGQGINTLVPMGAPRAAGVYPAARLMQHERVMLHIAAMLSIHKCEELWGMANANWNGYERNHARLDSRRRLHRSSCWQTRPQTTQCCPACTRRRSHCHSHSY